MSLTPQENKSEHLQWVEFLLSNLGESKNSFDKPIIEKISRRA